MVNKFTPGATVSTERKWKKDRKQRMKERKTEQNEEPYHSALMCSAFFFVYLWPFVIVVCIVIYILLRNDRQQPQNGHLEGVTAIESPCMLHILHNTVYTYTYIYTNNETPHEYVIYVVQCDT